MNTDKVALLKEFPERDAQGAKLLLGRFVTTTVVIEYSHAEAESPTASDCRPDSSHPHDPERLPVNL